MCYSCLTDKLENEKNIQNDHWRLDQIRKSTSKPGHPYNKFSTGIPPPPHPQPFHGEQIDSSTYSPGNKQTLEITPRKNGIDVRKELLRFHSTHYSANLMCLTVLGRGLSICLSVLLLYYLLWRLFISQAPETKAKF